MKSITTFLAALALATTVSFAEEKPAPGEKPAGEKPKANPEEFFKKLDANADGAVSLEEFKTAGIGKKDPAKGEEVFKRKDKDANGSLSLEEFKAKGPRKEKQ
jgi:hypothetical protein